MYRAQGALTDVVPSGQLAQPSGLAIEHDLLYASDRASSTLYAFDKQGRKVNSVDTGLDAGHVGSIAFGPDGKLYFVDTPGNRVYRVDPRH